MAYAGFFNGGVSVTSHCNDVKILHYNYSSVEELEPKLQLTMIKYIMPLLRKQQRYFIHTFA